MERFLLIAAIALAAGCTRSDADRSHAPSNADNAKTDHSKMGHSMIESSPGAADAPIDLQFIDTMIAHHQGAIEMSKLAETQGDRPELKKYAIGIAAEQDREVTQMKRWRDDWHKGAKPAINIDFPGMREGMRGMDMVKLSSLNGKALNVEFLRQMISHHEGALTMSRSLKEKAGARSGSVRTELLTLADAIIATQEAEIKQMNEWLVTWSR